MTVLDLYLTRHGQSWGNVQLDGADGYYIPLDKRMPGTETGRMDCDWYLTPLGQQQAELLGERLSAVQFDAIWCSPLERAHATAKAIGARQPKLVELTLERECMELFDYGDHTPEEWRARALRVVCKLRGAHPPGARVLVVAHGAFNDFLLNALFDMPGPAHLFRFFHNNTGLTRVLFHTGDRPNWDRVRLHHMNDLSHLPQEFITS